MSAQVSSLRLLSLLSIAGLSCACSGLFNGEDGPRGRGQDEDTADTNGDTDPDPDPETPPCAQPGFESEPQSWPLPSLAPGSDWMDKLAVDATTGCSSGQLAAELRDMDGDGRLDLLVTDSCDSAGVGTKSWEVYTNTGSGFSQDKALWSFEQLVTVDDWLDESWTDQSCGDGDISVHLMDLDGDARPDLVMTDACGTGTVGSDTWQIFENTGDGFADAVDWSLPPLFPGYFWMTDPTQDIGCDGGDFVAQLTDMSGDGRPDLVVSDHCDSKGVGTTHWEIYENTGSGFEATPVDWSLPGLVSGSDWMTELSQDTSCDGARLTVQLADLSADGRPDLVVSDYCDSAGVGTFYWQVYENTGTGFSTEPLDWEIPALLTGDDWITDLYTDIACGEGRFHAELMDFDRDGAVDLVVSDYCDARGVGTDTWHVYRNTGAGFADQAIEIQLPNLVTGDDPLDELVEDEYCGEGHFRSHTMDVNADGLQDLVITDACDATGVGEVEWLWVPGTCQD